DGEAFATAMATQRRSPPAAATASTRCVRARVRRAHVRTEGRVPLLPPPRDAACRARGAVGCARRRRCAPRISDAARGANRLSFASRAAPHAHRPRQPPADTLTHTRRAPERRAYPTAPTPTASPPHPHRIPT